MFQHRIQHFWSRSLLILLVALTAIGTTAFVAAQPRGAHAAAGPNSNFEITADGDAYTFTNQAPSSHTGNTIDFGSWGVTGPAGSGTVSGNITTTTDGSGNVFETLNLQSPFLSGKNYMREYPTLPAPAAGLTTTVNTPESPLGDEVLQECTTPVNGNVACGDHFVQGADGPLPAEEFLLGNGSPQYLLMQQGIDLQSKGFSAVNGAASLAPALPGMARTHGGGPLAISQPQVAALAPLAIFAIGIVLGVAGLATSSVCLFATCSSKVKGSLAIIGGLMTIAGGIMLGGSGVVFAPSRAASAAQVASGIEMTTTAIAEGSAITSARLTAIEESLNLLTNATVAATNI
jgi:hypothetical protein